MKHRFHLSVMWDKFNRGGLMIAGLYILLGGLWILFSDRLAALLLGSSEPYLTVSLFKGWGYVLVTGVLLYILIQGNNRSLRKANRDYLLLAENITDVIWVLDLETSHFTYISPSIEKLRGLTPEEAMHETLPEALSPASLDYLNRILPSRLETFKAGRTRSYTDELEQYRKDGSPVWVEITSRFVLNPENGHTEVYAASRDVSERWQAQEALRKNEARFHSAFDNMLEGAQILGHDWRYLYLNAEAEIHNRRPNRELLGNKYMDMWPGIEETHVFAVIKRCMDEREATKLENRFVYPDGKVGWFALSIQPVPEGVFILSVDITERVLAEEQVKQMKRLYATLSQVNQTIVRVKDRDELYQSICDVAVQYGKFALAWISLLDEATGDVRPVAAHGLDVSNWPFPMINIHNGPFENGPIAAAIRTSKVVTSEDLQTDERIKSHQIKFQELGFRSSAAVPFGQGGKIIGTLNLVSSEAGLFKVVEEMSLLEEMGMDISFALDTMESERIRRQWADAFEHCALGMAIGNPSTNRIQTCNPVFAHSLRRTIEEISGTQILDIYLPEDHGHIRQSVAESDHTGHAQFETRMVRKDGSTFPVQMDVASVRDEGGTLLYRVATQQDITKRRQAEKILEQQNLRLKTLREIDTAILASDSVENIVGAALEHIRELIDCERANLALIEWEKNEAVNFDVRDTKESAISKGARVSLDLIQNILQALSKDEPVIMEDLTKIPDPPPQIKIFIKEGLRSRCILPLFSQGKLIGAFTLSSKNPNYFDEEKVNLGREVVNQVAIAITQKRLVEGLREGEDRLAGILNSTMDAIISLNANQRIILFNPAAEQMFGFRADEVIGQPLDRIIPERFHSRHREHVRFFGQTNQTRRSMGILGPLTCLRANGEEFPAEITISQLQTDGQKIYTAILRDVTERLQAEEALQKSELRYRVLFDDSPVSIWEEDFSQVKKYLDALKQQGIKDFRAYFAAHPEAVLECGDMVKILDVNKAAVKMFRADSKEALIAVTHGGMSRGELEHHHEDLIAIANGRTSNHWEGGDETLTGEPLEISLSWSVVPGYERDYSRVVVTTIDITERKQAERELRLSELRYRTVVENQTEFIVRWKPNGTRTFANEAYHRYFGIAADQAVSSGFMPLIVEEDRGAVEEKISRLLSGVSVSETDVHRVIKPDGSIGWQEWVDQAIYNETGQITEFLSVGRDITERKRSEQQIQLQLRRMRALNEIDRAISSSLDMRVSLDVLLSEVLSQLGVDAASVLLLNTFDQTLEFVAGRGYHTSAIRQSHMRLGEGLAGQVGLERKVIHIQDLAVLGGEFKRAELLKDEKFVEYFGVPLIAKGLLKGVLEIFHRTRLDPDLEWASYLETLGGQAAIAIDNVQMFEGVQQLNMDLVAAYDATITGWSRAMDLRDKETEGHTQRVTELTLKLAERLGVSRHELVHIRRGALLHDIGKLGVPDQILHKPGKLSDEEWAIMRQHPTYAFGMLNSIHYLRPAIDIPYCHHEKWDGSGYPRGLRGEQIPLAARLFAVVDVWDALRSDRPYRASWSVEQTLEYIREQVGKHFDPKVVEAFLQMVFEK